MKLAILELIAALPRCVHVDCGKVASVLHVDRYHLCSAHTYPGDEIAVNYAPQLRAAIEATR
jgi:hypothetical protein